MLMRLRACLAALFILLVTSMLAACGGGGGSAELDGTNLPPAVQQEVPSLPQSQLPVFPDELVEREHPAGVSATENVQTGSQAWMMQSPGSSFNGTALELDGNAGPTSLWGMWRWTNFQGGLPIRVLLDFDIDAGGEFYVLLSDYGTGRWKLIGPLPETFANDSRTSYPVGDFVSPGDSTYVGVLTTAGTSMTINTVTLLADDDLTPPNAPENLVASDEQPGSVMLDWDDLTDPTLDGYNVYYSPNGPFELGDAGVQQMNLFPVSISEYLANGLVPNTTYNFGVTSVDMVGNESGLSNIVEATTTDDTPPGMPTGLTIDSIGSTTVNLSWTAPADLDIQGYNIYIGNTLDFDLADGEKQDGALYPGTSGVRDGLTPDQEYFARVTAVDVFNQESVPSGSVNFTTVTDAPPVPDFIVSPGYVEVGEIAFFNPSPTFDPDTDSSELTFEWDFDNDDVIDESSTGPVNVNWTFNTVGPTPVSLTVSDALSSVELNVMLMVHRSYERFNFGNGAGNAGSVLGLATCPENSLVGIPYRDDNNDIKLRYYNGSTWSVITMPAQGFTDFAVSPQGPAALYIDVTANSVTWSVQRYNGSWNTIRSQTISGLSEPSTATSQLAIGNNGRISVGVVYFNKPGFGDPVYQYHVWHEKADSSLLDINVFGGTRPSAQFTATDLTRTDDTSYLLDNVSGSVNLNLITITDSGSTTSSGIQTINGVPSRMYIDTDPDSPSQVFWGMLNSTDRIYYGDNYGTANGGSQFVNAGSAAEELAAIGFAGDNEAEVFWLDEYTTGDQELRGYTTIADSVFSVGSGIGFADNAFGGYHDTGSGSGVWIVVRESRDGQVVARYIESESVADSLVVHNPVSASTIFTKSAPVVFPDDSITSPHLQGYPTALVGNIAADHASSTTQFVGSDAYVLTNFSCLTGNLNEYMLGGIDTNGVMVLNLLVKGLTGATQSLVVEGVGMATMEYDPNSSTIMLLYTTGGSTTLNYRTYNAGSWSAPSVLIGAGPEIKRMDSALRADGDFGVIVANASDKLLMLETSSGSWQPSVEIYDGALTVITSFIGMDYDSTNEAAVVVNREPGGIWLGTIPDGGSVSWEEVDPLLSANAYSLNVAHDSSDNPVLVYLRSNTSFADSDVYITEKLGGSWVPDQAPSVVKLLGIPLGLTQDSARNIIIGGADKGATPKAICVIYYD
ncbi:fibronectin type III domain-containing protein [bacterium]|nr:fibronectin type III domain-containing protein [bacterium]